MAKINRPKGSIIVHKATITVWEKSHKITNSEKGYYRNVFGGIIRLMRQRKWHVGEHKGIKRPYSTRRKQQRLGVHPSRLVCFIHYNHYHIGLTFRYNTIKGGVGRNRSEHVTYPAQKRCEMEIDHIVGWLIHNCGYILKQRAVEMNEILSAGIDVDTWLEERMRDAHWHGFERAIHDGTPMQQYNCRCMDGMVKNGDRVYFLEGHAKRRWGVGIAEHNINSMWWIKVGKYTLHNICCADLRITMPESLSYKRQRRRCVMEEKARKRRLENLMLHAAEERRYTDAERMRVALENRRYMP